MAHPKVCVWQEDQDGNWDTQCGGCFVIEDGTPSENDMKYCYYCGERLAERRYMSDYEDDEDALRAP